MFLAGELVGVQYLLNQSPVFSDELDRLIDQGVENLDKEIDEGVSDLDSWMLPLGDNLSLDVAHEVQPGSSTPPSTSEFQVRHTGVNPSHSFLH